MAELTQADIENWIQYEATGKFHYTKVKDGVIDPKLYPQLRVMMHRAKEKGLAYPVDGKDGWWRPADKSLEELVWWDGGNEIGENIILPLEMNKYCYIPRPSLIIYTGMYNAGKGHPYDTPILTDDGFIPIGEVSVGDFLFTPEGKRTRITGLYPRGEQDVYKFTFTDGASVEVDSGHLWKVQTMYQRMKRTGRGNPNGTYKKWLLMETSEIIQRFGIGDIPSARLQIPRTKPIEHFGFQGLAKFPPYFLGLLLGDGSLTQAGVRFSTCDSEIIEYLNTIGVTATYTGHNNYKLRLGKHRLPHGLKCLAKDKFVPRNYLLGSISKRKQLLRGLLDTDGYVKDSQVYFYSVSKQLAEDVRFLVESLGGRANILSKIPTYDYGGEKRIGQRCYIVQIGISNFCPFKLKRKAQIWKPKRKSLNRTLKRIDYIGKKSTICLSIEDEGGLYLSKDFIVTHNTALCINTVNLNLELWENKLDFYVSEGAEMMKAKFETLNSFIPKPPPFKTYRRTGNFADVIDPDHLSIIDYLRVDMNKPYEIGSKLFEIFNKLKTGIAVVAMQKPPGERKLAFGGASTAFEPSLYLGMDRGSLGFEKIKVPKMLDTDPYSLKITFKISKGVNFFDVHTLAGDFQ
jgi:hypothetical protein